MKLSTDKKNLQVKISGVLSAADLESLIADLAALRAQMEPQVPLTVDALKKATESRNVSVVDEPDMEVRPLKDGRIRIWMRSGGLGWLIFNLTRNNAVVLRDYLIASTGDSEISSLLGDDISDSPTAH